MSTKYTVYNLTSLIDQSIKLKQNYLTVTAVKKVIVFREEVTLSRASKFCTTELPRVLRVLLRQGVFPSEVEIDVDDLGYASYIKLVLEEIEVSRNNSKMLLPLCQEFIADDISIAAKKTQLEVSYMEVTKPPLKVIKSLYIPLGMVVEISAYGIIDIGGSSSYAFAVSLGHDIKDRTSEEKKRLCLKYMLPTEIVSKPGKLTNLSQLTSQSKVIDVFMLPDNVRIEFTMRNSNGFVYNSNVVVYGKATFLSNTLPEAGWFVKVNRKIGKMETVLLVETSWELTASQKAYISKHK